MTYINYDPRAHASMLARNVEKPRTLETALAAWLASRNPSLMPQVARAVIARRLQANR